MEHDWRCVAPEGGYYRWQCQNDGCFESVPYPSPAEAFRAKGECKGRKPEKKADDAQ